MTLNSSINRIFLQGASCLVACVMAFGAAVEASDPLAANQETQQTHAQEKKLSKKEKRALKKMENIKEKYAPTGETENCITVRHMRNSVIIDDQTIFFKHSGKYGYMNKLKRECPRLENEGRFSYEVFGSRLCRNEIITVLDSFGRSWASCSLGEFEEWSKIPKEQSSEKQG